MIKNIIISQEAIQFLEHKERKGDANLVVHRDDPSFSCCNVQPSTFIIDLDIIYGEKPDESFFIICDNSYGIPIWIEKRLFSYLENQPILISLKKGFFKRLKIEIGSEVFQSQ